MNIIFILVTLLLNSVRFGTSADLVSFSDHCTSLVAGYSTPAEYAGVNSTVHSLTGLYHTTYEGHKILSQSSAYGEVQTSILFRFWYDEAADEQGLLRVQGSLEFPRRTSTFAGKSTSIRQVTDLGTNSVPYVRSLTSFELSGIWSEASGEICMVGSAPSYSKQGNLLELPAVLMLYKVKNSSSLTSLISGTFESLVYSKYDPNYFQPISLLMLPSMNYQYTFASSTSHYSCSDGSDGPPSSLRVGKFCPVISNLVIHRRLQLKYPSRCLNVDCAKNCSPLAVPYLPANVWLKNIECLEDEKKIRVLVDFSGSGSWNPNATLVGEGSWDATNNQVVIVACRFLNATDAMNNSHLGDCSVVLSFWFAAKWTIGNASSIVGKIWSSKTAADSGYFETITFESGQHDVQRFTLPGQEYEYTKTDQVTKLCKRKKTGSDSNKNSYPYPFSISMRLHYSIENSTGEEIAWGISNPLSVGNQFYDPWSYSIEDGTEEYPLGTESPPVNYTYDSTYHHISYRIDMKAKGQVQLPNGFYIINSHTEMVISAEGVYDDKEGSLCMVGCRDLSTNRHRQPTRDSIDCEIVIHIQFPPTNSKTSYRSFINGSIESTRDKSDPLYFERVELKAGAGYSYEAARSITMDLEIILVLISNTLACVFGTFQLFHLNKHPEVLPSISISMLNLLTLGYLFPLLLSFDTMTTPDSSQTLFLGSNGWHELSALLVMVLLMVGTILQVRLLQLTRSARSANENRRTELWVKKLALIVALPVHVAVSVALLMISWGKREYIVEMVSRYQGHIIFGSLLKACTGLVVDWFLLPQIVLNIFCKSKEKSLAVSFIIGTTFVRVLPHAYNLYRAHTSAYNDLNESYIYASPPAYFQSTTWNAIVSCVSLLFAGIVFLQQRFGGHCILPLKWKEFGHFGVYEQVTIASEVS